jgi:hypothetical protein
MMVREGLGFPTRFFADEAPRLGFALAAVLKAQDNQTSPNLTPML